jgi:hypothetical protein
LYITKKILNLPFCPNPQISQYKILSLNYARIVNVCSQLGYMGGGVYKKELIDQFERADFTVVDIDKFAEDFKK